MQVRVFGGSPKVSSQPQNIFVRVESWTWISRPMTGSYVTSVMRSAPRGRVVEADRPLERVGGLEQAVLAERRAGELEADGHPLAEPGRDRDRWDAGERHRHREVVVEVHREGIVGLGAERKGDAGTRGGHDEVDVLEGGAEVVGDLRADALRAAIVGVVVARRERVGPEHDAPFDLGPEAVVPRAGVHRQEVVAVGAEAVTDAVEAGEVAR